MSSLFLLLRLLSFTTPVIVVFWWGWREGGFSGALLGFIVGLAAAFIDLYVWVRVCRMHHRRVLARAALGKGMGLECFGLVMIHWVFLFASTWPAIHILRITIRAIQKSG